MKQTLGWADRPGRRPVSNAILGLLAVGAIVWLLLDFRRAVVGLFSTMAWVSVGFAMIRLAACLTPKPRDLGLAQNTTSLPRYTVLVPLFHEAGMIAQIIAALSRLNYEPSRVEILLITEASDPLTTEAVRRALPTAPAQFQQVVVPVGTPQTKPRALNHAMQSATGTFVTIYDAEDIPHPDQLLAAVAAFRAHPDVVAVQAPLDYHNADVNALTRQFGLEYAGLFHVWVPFLARLGLPFPLGGTSNHMRREALDAVGGWDAYNVTEDADLSFRLAAQYGRIGYIHPPTLEEAVSIPEDWRKQRSRWLKGYMQTWDVQMGAAFAPGGWRGVRRFLTLQLTLGLTLLSVLFYTPILIALPCIAVVLFWIEQPLQIGPIYGLTFAVSIAVGCLVGAVGAARMGQPRLMRACFGMPLYWAMLFRPLVQACREWRGQRFLWHKTRHGVSGSVDLKLDTESHDHAPLRRPHP